MLEQSCQPYVSWYMDTECKECVTSLVDLIGPYTNVEVENTLFHALYFGCTFVSAAQE